VNHRRNTRVLIALALLLTLNLAMTQWPRDDDALPADEPTSPTPDTEALHGTEPGLRGAEQDAQPKAASEASEPETRQPPIRFTVVDWAGAAVAGAHVRVDSMKSMARDPRTGESTWEEQTSGFTDANGRIDLDRKLVNRPPGSPRTLRWRVDPPRERKDLLLAGRAGMLSINDDVRVQLSRGYVIAGTLVDAAGAPHKGVVVQFSTGARCRTVTDDQGRFAFRPLPRSGRTPWRLWVRSPDAKDVVFSGAENSTEIWGGEQDLRIVVEPTPGRPGYFRPVR